MACVGVHVASGSSESLPRGALHPGFCKSGSGVVVMTRTIDACGRHGLHVSCELGAPCKVKSNRFVVTRGYESLDLFVTS